MCVLLLADLDSLPPEKQAVFLNCFKAVLLELYRVVKNAEEIIQGCCSQDWLKAAIKLANSVEVFADVFFKLDWCTSVVSIIFSDAMSASELEKVARNVEGFGEEEYDRKIEEIHSVLTKHALHDCESLRRRLITEQHDNRSLTPDQQEIVANLLKLLATDPVGMSEQKTKKIDLLLTIKPEKLVHINRIGKGSYGVVSKVKWLGQNFAKKSFKLCSEHRFQQEAEMLASVSHPHIVQVFGRSVDNRTSECSLVMELMDEDLIDHIDAFMKSPSGPELELPVALDIMLQVAEAMLYLHTKKIVHRDVKAANILINHAKIEEMEKAGYVQAKVADLGESKIKLSGATYSPQTQAGTTRWMAPELFEKEKSSDEIKYPFKADVYSYAITCSEILNMGKLPFADIEKQSELKEAVRKGIRPTLPDSLPLSLMSLIKQCWDADPSMRPSFSRICAELRHIKNLHMISNVVTKLKDASWLAGQMEANHTMVEQSSTTMMQIPQRVFDILHQRLEVLWKFSRNKSMIGKSIFKEDITKGAC